MGLDVKSIAESLEPLDIINSTSKPVIYFESVDSFLKKCAVMGFGTCVIATRTRNAIAPTHPIHQFSGFAAKRQVDKSHNMICIGPPNFT